MKREKPQFPASKDSKTALVEIEKPIYGGAFLARMEGKAVFVPLTLPGEQARVRITEEKRNYATGEIEEIVAAAPERITPCCQHFGTCGGCHYQHTEYETQLTLKKTILRETLERGGVRAPAQIEVLAGEPWGYRNRIRVAFDQAGNPGYRGRRSHTIVPISECPIAAPLLVRSALSTAKIAREFAPALKLAEISLFCNGDETELLVSLFITNPPKVDYAELAKTLSHGIPELRGIELAIEAGKGQAARTVAHWGQESLTYRAGGFDYRVDHGAFFQVNHWLVDALIEHVSRSLTGALAWDLFAGVGLFARRLTENFGKVAAIESAPAATMALTQNLVGTVGRSVKGETLAFLRTVSKKERPDLIVVDPPRIGLGAEITALLAGIAAPSLVYVSCDPATLARDLRVLVDSGYESVSVTLADLFPQTFHLETVVRLHRS
jgi:23S rRNA (uracil1939-C5)-methyltransferase